MAAAEGFSPRLTIQRDAVVFNGTESYPCKLTIDADLWPAVGVPKDMGGFLELPRSLWETLASSPRLVLRLSENGEPYRMILDAITGRFVARQL